MCEVRDVSSRTARCGERDISGQDLKDSSGEYVKFSKDKFWLEPPSEKLKKQLEEELKLSGSNLKSHAWYHGRIPWEMSESLVVNPGDFLVRDSQSSQGDFVLTSRWEQKTLHFIIRKTVVQSSETYTRVQYSLEGEAFDSLPALVHFYVGSKAALTRWSKAQIHRPVNRTLPLSYLESSFCPPVSVSGEERLCPRSPSFPHHREADVHREQDDRPPITAGESSLSPLYNNHLLRKLGERSCYIISNVLNKFCYQGSQCHNDDPTFTRTLASTSFM